MFISPQSIGIYQRQNVEGIVNIMRHWVWLASFLNSDGSLGLGKHNPELGSGLLTIFSQRYMMVWQ